VYWLRYGVNATSRQFRIDWASSSPASRISNFIFFFDYFCYALPMPFSSARQKRKLDDVELYEYAVASLARRMRTVAELKRLLRARAHPDEDGTMAVEVVIAKLKEQKYLNDSRYAAAYSQYRQTNEKFGRRRVITDLKAKGVHNDVIDQAVNKAYEEVNEEKLARQFLDRKRLKKPQNQRESARAFRMLTRAGFSSKTIFVLLKRWDIDAEVLGALESEAESHGE
jgi:regulatory protein